MGNYYYSFKFLKFRKAFCRKMEGVLPQNGMRFAAKWKAFCRKMEIVLPQNGKLFGPKWVAFWPKMESVLAQNGLRFGCVVFQIVEHTYSESMLFKSTYAYFFTDIYDLGSLDICRGYRH